MTILFFLRHYIKKPLYEKFVILDYTKKRELLLKYSNFYSSKFFVETGTFLGDTTEAMKNHFQKTFTIELQAELARKCTERFKEDTVVQVFQGNSSSLLPGILSSLQANTLFWLDAHYSSEFYMGKNLVQTARAEKETPIMDELEIILSAGLKNNVILIDDARCFTGKNDYPRISELKTFLHEKGILKKQIKIKNDIIRITPLRFQ